MIRPLLGVLSHLMLLPLALLATQLGSVVCYGTVVRNLPGFDGDLPFKLETGYVSVETSELFYYFIESEGTPKKDPLLLWYSGGPGCSALKGLIYEIGPLAFNLSAYDGGIPPISYYPYSWTKSSSILFVDAPVTSRYRFLLRNRSICIPTIRHKISCPNIRISETVADISPSVPQKSAFHVLSKHV